MSAAGRVVADAQLRHEIAIYERARLRADDGVIADAWAERLASLWAELRATSSRSATRRRTAAPVVRLARDG